MTDDIDTLARTICGEARGGGDAGMQAVANVVLNRVAVGGWWGHTIAGVCRKPFQFSCWNEGDPNLPIIENLNTGMSIFNDALNIAIRAVDGHLEDITGGATSYYAKSMKAPPRWALGMVPSADIAGQLFFKELR